MNVLPRLRSMLSLFLRRNHVEAELHEEVDSFYETIVEGYTGRGVPEAEARRLARVRFGHPERVKEQVRDSRTGSRLDSLFRNFRYTVRGISKAPGYAAVTMLTLGVGIGANAIVSCFALHHAPVPNPETLIAIHTTQGSNQRCNNFSWPLYQDLRERGEILFRDHSLLRSVARIDQWHGRARTRLGASCHC